MRNRYALAFGLCGLCMVAGLCEAQLTSPEASAPVAADARVRQVLGRLQPQIGIRVRSGATVTEGWAKSLQGDSILVGTANGTEVRLPISEIDGLWSREGSGGRGAIVAGLFGALFLGTIASVVESSLDSTFCDPFDCEKQSASLLPLAIVIGGVGGGAIGLLIGRNIKRWKTRYP